jgi:hypothetical protein
MRRRVDGVRQLTETLRTEEFVRRKGWIGGEAALPAKSPRSDLSGTLRVVRRPTRKVLLPERRLDA